jgi:23S rRNA (cytosine1962-C5)-methyltransferase
MSVIKLKKGGGRLLKSGGAWIFDNECENPEEQTADGDIVEVADFDGYPMGRGVWNSASKIRVRMLTRKAGQDIDDAFLRMRVKNAWEYRKKTVETEACRIIFGEADFLPGLTVDKYGDVLVVESLSLGIDRLKMRILEILKEVLAEDGITVRGIYERSDSKERLKEGMERIKGFIGPEFDTQVIIEENGIRFFVDVKEGQKTGYFLDQKYNRLAIRKCCSGADVLDCFTHTGAFALNAAKAGAKSVLGLDASETGILQAKKNAELNHLEETAHFETADVFEALPAFEKEGRKFDVIILDPPAFAKTRQNVKNAEKGYREINRRAMGLVKDGGFLATCSCSHFMTQELFSKMLYLASSDAHRRLRQVEFRTQSPDHPILWSADETYYLKFYIFQVTEEK